MKMPALQRACSCESPAEARPHAAAARPGPSPIGNHVLQRMLLAKEVQAKLAVSEPGDELERDADETAEAVMRMADPAAPVHEREAASVPRIQRKCAACGGATAGSPSQCPACEAQERSMQRKPAGNAAAVGASPLVPGHGMPLPRAARAFFEPRFQRDFGDVRVHADRDAAGAAQALDALAYTRGHDIVFGDGQYAPGTTSGRRLLAHELTHVVQQMGPRPPAGVPHAPRLAAPAGARPVQRLVRRSLLNGCGAGQNPFAADRRASTLLTNAIDRIDTALAERPADAADPDVVAIGNAMRTAFRLDPANDDNWNLPAPRFGLPLVRRRLEAARDYIDSVVFTVNCCTVGGACPATCGTCAAGEEAFVCAGETSIITLCPLFFTRGTNQRGRTLAHEVLHITFGHIRDWDQPDRANAHCYAQFTALANDFNSPAGFRCH